MVVRMLPMGLDPGRRRLVVGKWLWLLPLARSAGETSAVSAGAASLLVVSASLSAALPSANADSATGPHADTKSDLAATRSPFTYSTAEHYRESSWCSADSNAAIHRRAGWSVANTDAKNGYCFGETDSNAKENSRPRNTGADEHQQSKYQVDEVRENGRSGTS